MRFPEAGKRRTLGFVASYQSRGDPYHGSPSRTSYLPVTAMVTRSQKLSVDLVRAPTETTKKSLIVKLTNQDGKTEAVSVEGMYGLGAMVRSDSQTGPTGPLQYSDSKSVCIDVLEQPTSGVSDLLPTTASANQQQDGQADPLFPLSSLLGNSLSGTALDTEVGRRAASIKNYLDKLGEVGPRSIAEVRRENVKKKEAEREGEGGMGMPPEGEEEEALHPDLGFKPSEDAQDLAAHEHSQKAVCVLMLWSVSGGEAGTKRYGVHWAAHLPFVTPLSLSVQHAPTVQLEGSSGKAMVPITLVLRNTSPSCSFRVSVQGLDLGSSKIDQSRTNRGLRWLGKIKFMHLSLEPGATRRIVFRCWLVSAEYSMWAASK